MGRRRVEKPLASYLLRVKEVRIETMALRYELVDLRTGATLQFTSLAALKAHLGGNEPARQRRTRA